MLNQDYKEMLSLLLDDNVDFLLVGAYALAVYGFPRATGDIDLFIRPSPENASKLVGVLKKFGTPLEKISKDDFSRPGIALQIGVAPRRIDLITKIDGLTYEEASRGKEIIEIEDLRVPVISQKNLIVNKLATGREKDKIDARNLENSK